MQLWFYARLWTSTELPSYILRRTKEGKKSKVQMVSLCPVIYPALATVPAFIPSPTTMIDCCHGHFWGGIFPAGETGRRLESPKHITDCPDGEEVKGAFLVP